MKATDIMAVMLIILFIYSMVITVLWREEHKRAESWKQQTLDIVKKMHPAAREPVVDKQGD